MSGNCSPLPEPDLSHFQCWHGVVISDTGIGRDDIFGRKSGNFTHSSLLPWAFVVSLVLHSVLLSLNLSSTAVTTISVAPKSLRVELKSVSTAPVIKASVVVEPIAAPKVEQVRSSEAIVREENSDLIEKQDKPRLIIPLTPEDLHALRETSEDLLEPGHANFQGVNPQPFGGVFDPRLRKKLQSRKAFGRVGDVALSTYQLANGSAVVELSDEHCLSTLPQGRRENATNWYHTGCHGKTESERMMDRINNSLK